MTSMSVATFTEKTMKNHNISVSSNSNEKFDTGIYLCTTCSFAVAVIAQDEAIPKCPCCENNDYIAFSGSDYEMTDIS